MAHSLTLRVSPVAERDLEAIGDYIAKDSARMALRFIVELRETFGKIAATPLAFRERSELGKDVRSCAHGNYVIFFKATARQIVIARVLHGAMDLPAQFTGDEN